jgi:hypothetical protein
MLLRALWFLLLSMTYAHASDWRVIYEVSKIDGQETVNIGRTLARPEGAIALVCSTTGPSLALQIKENYFRPGAMDGIYRTPSGQPIRATWIGRGGMAYLVGDDARTFIHQIPGSDYIYLRIAGYETDIYVAGFNKDDRNVKRLCGF